MIAAGFLLGGLLAEDVRTARRWYLAAVVAAGAQMLITGEVV